MHLSITASMMNLATMTLMESPDMHRSLSFSTISCWVYGWWERIPDWPNPARVCLFWTLWSVASNHCYLPWSIHQDTVPLLSCERSCGWSLLSALTILWGNQLWILAAQSMWIQRSGWYQLVCLWCSCLVPPHLLLPSAPSLCQTLSLRLCWSWLHLGWQMWFITGSVCPLARPTIFTCVLHRNPSPMTHNVQSGRYIYLASNQWHT